MRSSSLDRGCPFEVVSASSGFLPALTSCRGMDCVLKNTSITDDARGNLSSATLHDLTCSRLWSLSVGEAFLSRRFDHAEAALLRPFVQDASGQPRALRNAEDLASPGHVSSVVERLTICVVVRVCALTQLPSLLIFLFPPSSSLSLVVRL